MQQGSKIALVRSYLRVHQAAGQVKILIFLVKINFFPIYAISFSNAEQVPILRYFETCADLDQTASDQGFPYLQFGNAFDEI